MFFSGHCRLTFGNHFFHNLYQPTLWWPLFSNRPTLIFTPVFQQPTSTKLLVIVFQQLSPTTFDHCLQYMLFNACWWPTLGDYFLNKCCSLVADDRFGARYQSNFDNRYCQPSITFFNNSRYSPLITLSNDFFPNYGCYPTLYKKNLKTYEKNK